MSFGLQPNTYIIREGANVLPKTTPAHNNQALAAQR